MEKPAFYSVLPANVRYDEHLKANEKILYSEITALCTKDGTCWASNNYFAKLYHVSTVSISTWINHLKKLGYVSVTFEYETGTKRIAKRIIGIKQNFNTPQRKVNGGVKENFKDPIKENFKDNITSINNTSKSKKTNKEKPKQGGSGVRNDFEKLWKLYPNKKGKEKAFNFYQKALKHGVTNKQIQDGIVKYKQEIAYLKTDMRYIKHGSTWFNQSGWDDDYQTPEPRSSKQSELDRVIAIQKREDLIYNKCSEFGSIEKALPVIQETYPDITWEKADRIFHPERYLSRRGVENAN